MHTFIVHSSTGLHVQRTRLRHKTNKGIYRDLNTSSRIHMQLKCFEIVLRMCVCVCESVCIVK